MHTLDENLGDSPGEVPIIWMASELQFRPKIELLSKIQGCHRVRHIENHHKRPSNPIPTAAGSAVANEKARPSLLSETPSVLVSILVRADFRMVIFSPRCSPVRQSKAYVFASAIEPGPGSNSAHGRLRITFKLGLPSLFYEIFQGSELGK